MPTALKRPTKLMAWWLLIKLGLLSLLFGSSTHANDIANHPSFVLNSIRWTAPMPAIIKRCMDQRSQALLGKRLHSDDLLQLRQHLTQHCLRQAGWANSSVLLPDQRLQNGQLVLMLRWGRLSALAFNGLDALPAHWLHWQLQDLQGQPLHLPSLQQRLLATQQHPLLKRFDAQLTPIAEASHQAKLTLQVEEASPYFGYLRLDNHRSPAIGSRRLALQLGHHSLTGLADTLRLNAAFSSGLQDWGLSYQLPLSRNWQLLLDAQQSDAEIVEAPLADLDISTATSSYSLGGRWQSSSRQQSDAQWQTRLLLRHRRSRTTLLGQPISLSLGTDNGRATVSELEWGLSWQQKPGRNWSLLLASQLRWGQDWLGASNGQAVNGQHRLLLLQGQLLHRFKPQWHWRLVWGGQLSADPLLPLAKFGLGGQSTVRGYRENRLVRDNGWYVRSTIEYDWPSPNWRWSLFTDGGEAWNKRIGNISNQHDQLLSLGLGLRWQTGQHWRAHLEGAWPVRARGMVTDSLQKRGLHLALEYRW